jgi:hypothetical protein
MVKLRTFLGYSFSSLGVAFFVMTVIFVFASDVQTGVSNLLYPYRPLAVPALVSGLVFFNSGVIGIWLEYLIFKQRKKLLSKIELNQRREKKN